jgi:DNA invertase Pin-like site-specific DNA recombinase
MGAAGGWGGRAGAGLPRAAAYLRVSTGGQVDSTSIDTQREQCQALARAHGLVLVGEFVDAGVSGAAASRPALDELLAAAAAGEVEVVLVAKLDRLGRSLLHLLGLIEHLTALGLRVISASDSIDTRTPAGRMMLGLLGAFAEFERERLRERSVDGASRRALAGGFVGSSPPFGYRPGPDPTGAAGVVLEVDPTQSACIRAMYRLLVRDRVPLTRAIKDLNSVGHRSASGKPWTKDALSRWVRGDGPTTAAGAWRWRDLRVAIPPILTAAEHEAWMAWKRESARPAHRHSAYLLGGRVRTPCGRYFHGRTAGRDSPVHVCRHRKQTRADDPERCGCRSIRVQTLDDAVWSQIRTALTTPPPPVAKQPRGRRRPVSGNRGNRGNRGNGGKGSGGSRLDIGPDTLLPRIADAAEDVARLQPTIATEYHAARAAGFDATTARLMLHPRRTELAAAQQALTRLQGIQEALAHVADPTVADRETLDRARARIDELDLDGKQQLLDLLDVQAQVTGYHPCPTCAGTGYQPIPPGHHRHWPPSCPTCHRLGVLPELTVHIGNTELLRATDSPAVAPALTAGPTTKTAG